MSRVSDCCVYCLTRHIISHFGDEPFQEIDCTGTNNQKQANKHYIYLKHKRQTEQEAQLLQR